MSETKDIILAIITFSIIISLTQILKGNYSFFPIALFFSILIILTSVLSKKIMAHSLDADVEHELWKWSQYGFRKRHHFKNPITTGIFLPLLFSIISLGTIKFLTFLTYETRALKVRAAKRFGIYSFTEITEWHNGLIGAAGIVGVLLLSAVAYTIPIPNQEILTKLAIYYSFWNIIPISKLDGAQIFFGSRVLWTTLAIITAILTTGSLLIQ